MLMKPWMKPVMGCVLAWNIFVVVLQVYLHMATPLDMHDTSGVAQLGDRAMHPLPLDGLKRAFAAVTIDLEASEAEKAALETRIRLLKRERRRLEAELTRELAAARPEFRLHLPSESDQPNLPTACLIRMKADMSVCQVTPPLPRAPHRPPSTLRGPARVRHRGSV